MLKFEVVSHLDKFIYNNNLKLSEIGLLNYFNSLYDVVNIEDISADDCELIKENLVSLESLGFILLHKVNDVVEVDLDFGTCEKSSLAKDLILEPTFKLNSPEIVKASKKNARKQMIINKFRKTVDNIFQSTEIRNKIYEFVVYLYYEQKQCFNGKELTNNSLENKLNKLLSVGNNSNWQRSDMIRAIDMTMSNGWLSFNAFECNPNLVNNCQIPKNYKKFIDITENNKVIDDVKFNQLNIEEKVLEIYKNICFGNEDTLDLEKQMEDQLNEVNRFKQLLNEGRYEEANTLYCKIENLVKSCFLKD